MSTRSKLRAQLLDDSLGRISPASFVDIVFLLLIFFLFGSFDFAEGQILTALAQDGPGQATDRRLAWLQVRVGSQSNVEYAVNDGAFVANETLVEQALRNFLSKPGVDPAVIVDPQSGVILQQIMDAFAFSRKCGAQQVGLRCQSD